MRLALFAVIATLTGPLVVLSASPASAIPADTNWNVTPPTGTVGTVTAQSNGAVTAAGFSYSMNPAGLSQTRTWTFQATALSTGTVTVPYTWQGSHAYYDVRVKLEKFVAGASTTLVDASALNCCASPPSAAFLYGGVTSFNVTAGQSYGFRLSGSNFDSNNFLQGTFTLSTKPFLDAQIGTDNRDWPGAKILPGEAIPETRKLAEPGEARWFKIPVSPGRSVAVTLDNLPADYDMALYGDIGAAFSELSTSGSSSVAQLAASASAAAPGAGTQVPEFDPDLTKIPTTTAKPATTQQFAPRVYAPRVYAPRVYAPRVYAPRVYAPRVYAPRVYAPGSYLPANITDTSFQTAYSQAQNQTLLAVSANTGRNAETVSASTGNTDGFFYVRVQGHTDQAFDATTSFQLTAVTTGDTDCVGLSGYPADTTPLPTPTVPNPETVIVTDTSKLSLTNPSPQYAAYIASLDDLATRTNGVVVNLAGRTDITSLRAQVGLHKGCPYAVNLLADAIKGVVDHYRNPNSKYVVIAGGDDVIPFFRYPDVSGLGQESQFTPPVLADSPSGSSLLDDQVQSQDAYGSSTTVTIGGSILPLPDLAVGRLVKTPEEIQGVIANFATLTNGTPAATPSRSLVTGYDFLADAATKVGDEFAAAMPSGTNQRLITPSGTPLTSSWHAADLETALLGSRHDLVYLAGHFSANDTLAADFDTTLNANLLDPDPTNAPANGRYAGILTNTIVLSAGCHSGYNIVNDAAVPPDDQGLGGTDTFDWTQRMAQQKAVLIGGTGYQYGDSDFLEYSERLYLDMARRLHENTAGPVRVGAALALAKQDYLSSLSTLSGIDQKAVLEATLYGLPMTGFDAPARTALPTASTALNLTTADAGSPGAAFGLQSARLAVATTNEGHFKPASGVIPKLEWLSGTDGVTVQPGAPALPKKVKDVTLPGQVLRGVGFLSGHYSDTSVYPLTGAPAIEGSTPNALFVSSAFWPQRLVTANYFGALGASGRTSLVLTPAQYRSEASGTANTQRNYSSVGTELFYTPSGAAGRTTQAAPPGISGVRATATPDGQVTFSVSAAGDPAAGVQKVWITWTGERAGDPGYGDWTSIDLVQNLDDSTRWSRTLQLPPGDAYKGVRFIVQAVNGVGALAMDTGEGDGYGVTEAGAVDTSAIALATGTPTAGSPLGVSATVEDSSGPVADRDVSFTVLKGGAAVYEFTGATDEDGVAVLTFPPGQRLPYGSLTVVAFIFDGAGQVFDSDTVAITAADTASVSLRADAVSPASPLGFTALVKDLNGAPVPGRPLVFTVSRGGQTLYTTDPPVLTDADGAAVAPVGAGHTVAPAGPITVRVDLVDTAVPPNVLSSATAQATVVSWTITPGPTPPGFLSAAMGVAYPLATPLTATVGDSYGTAGAGVPVTFTFPASGPFATFPVASPGTGTTRTRTVTTVTGGLATAPPATAGTIPGNFQAVLTAPGSVSALSIPLGASYNFSKFVSPVTNPTSTTPTGTTPIKISALQFGSAKISDDEAAMIVAQGRFQIRWRSTQSPVTGAWIDQRTNLTTYDPVKDFFQSDFKASTAGAQPLQPGKSYIVQVRILPVAGTANPVQSVLQGTFDLGTAEFILNVSKK